MKVMKFGGTSVGQPDRMHQVAATVTEQKEPKIVVLSSLSGTTNALVNISDALSAGDKPGAKKIIDGLEKHYHTFIKGLLKNNDLQEKLSSVTI